MSAAVPERVELGQSFKPFLYGVKEVKPLYRRYSRLEVSSEQGPSVFYGTARILSAPPLPDLLFTPVLGPSPEANTSRHDQRFWFEADQDYLRRNGLLIHNAKLALHQLDLERLPRLENLKALVLMPYGTYEASSDQALYKVGGNIKFRSFVQIAAGSRPGPDLTADPYNEDWLKLIEAKFTH